MTQLSAVQMELTAVQLTLIFIPTEYSRKLFQQLAADQNRIKDSKRNRSTQCMVS